MKVKIESYRALKEKYGVKSERNEGDYFNRDFLLGREALFKIPDIDLGEDFVLETSTKTSMGNTLINLIYYQLEKYDDLTTKFKFVKQEETLIQKTND